MEGEAFNPKSNVPAVKHRGGSIMLWGCFVAYGTGTLHKEDRKMKKTSSKFFNFTLKQLDSGILNKVGFSTRTVGLGWVYIYFSLCAYFWMCKCTLTPLQKLSFEKCVDSKLYGFLLSSFLFIFLLAELMQRIISDLRGQRSEPCGIDLSFFLAYRDFSCIFKLLHCLPKLSFTDCLAPAHDYPPDISVNLKN